MRTCGNYSASLFNEVNDADTFANDWKIDMLKYDACKYNMAVTSRPRYEAMGRALNKTVERTLALPSPRVFQCSRVSGFTWLNKTAPFSTLVLNRGDRSSTPSRAGLRGPTGFHCLSTAFAWPVTALPLPFCGLSLPFLGFSLSFN